LVDKELKFIFTKMDILQYLTKLVENQKEVGVSGLGTFYKKKSPGRYDVNMHSFIPPSLTLQFTREVTENRIFEDYVSKDRNISVESASYFIKQFADDITTRLNQNETVNLGNLGVLKNVEGQTLFYPKNAPESGVEYYGLPQVKEDYNQHSSVAPQEEPNLPGPDNKVTQDEDPVKEPILDPIVNSLIQPDIVEENKDTILEDVIQENLSEEENPGIEEETVFDQKEPLADLPNQGIAASYIISSQQRENSYPENNKVSNGMPLYLKLILLVVVLLIAFFAIYYMYPNTVNNTAETKAPVAASVPIAPVNIDTMASDSLALKDTLAAEETSTKDTISTTPGAATTMLPAATTYEVIGSSPYRLIEAEQFIQTMKTKHGITAKIVSQIKGKKIKVSIATFKTKKQADLEVPILSKKVGIKGLYTFTNTHKPE
jgi:nucleoid DNA-binding protein